MTIVWLLDFHGFLTVLNGFLWKPGMKYPVESMNYHGSINKNPGVSPGIFIIFFMSHVYQYPRVSLPRGEQPVMGTTRLRHGCCPWPFILFLTTCHRVQSGWTIRNMLEYPKRTPLKAISQVVLPGNLWLWTDHASWATWKPVGRSPGPLGASQGRLGPRVTF